MLCCYLFVNICINQLQILCNLYSWDGPFAFWMVTAIWLSKLLQTKKSQYCSHTLQYCRLTVLVQNTLHQRRTHIIYTKHSLVLLLKAGFFCSIYICISYNVLLYYIYRLVKWLIIYKVVSYSKIVYTYELFWRSRSFIYVC